MSKSHLHIVSSNVDDPVKLRYQRVDTIRAQLSFEPVVDFKDKPTVAAYMRYLQALSPEDLREQAGQVVFCIHQLNELSVKQNAYHTISLIDLMSELHARLDVLLGLQAIALSNIDATEVSELRKEMYLDMCIHHALVNTRGIKDKPHYRQELGTQFLIHSARFLGA